MTALIAGNMARVGCSIGAAVALILAAQISLASGQQQQQQSQQHFPDPCRDSKTGLLAHESYCDKYYICVDGQTELRDCPNGLIFIGRGKGLLEHCDYPWRGDCGNRLNRNAPIGTDHCEWLYGIFSHETSCIRYWTCWNGTAVEQYCIGGLLYNENTHVCDWPQNVDGCQKHPLCKDNPEALLALGKSCTRFWQCIGGYPRLQRCPATLVFDKKSKRCVEPPTEDCDVLPTPPPSASSPNSIPNTGGRQISGAIAIPNFPSSPSQSQQNQNQNQFNQNSNSNVRQNFQQSRPQEISGVNGNN